MISKTLAYPLAAGAAASLAFNVIKRNQSQASSAKLGRIEFVALGAISALAHVKCGLTLPQSVGVFVGQVLISKLIAYVLPKFDQSPEIKKTMYVTVATLGGRFSLELTYITNRPFEGQIENILKLINNQLKEKTGKEQNVQKVSLGGKGLEHFTTREFIDTLRTSTNLTIPLKIELSDELRTAHESASETREGGSSASVRFEAAADLGVGAPSRSVRSAVSSPSNIKKHRIYLLTLAGKKLDFDISFDKTQEMKLQLDSIRDQLTEQLGQELRGKFRNICLYTGLKYIDDMTGQELDSFLKVEGMLHILEDPRPVGPLSGIPRSE